MVKKSKAEDRHTDPLKKKQAEAGRKANLRGKSGERAVIKKISSWWDPDGEYEWVRSPNSGGSELKKDFDLAGDLATSCPDFPFHIEMKKDKRWEKLDKGLTVGDKWGVISFIEQAKDDCPKHRYPIVIFMMPGPSQPKFVALWDKNYQSKLFEMVLSNEKHAWFDLVRPGMDPDHIKIIRFESLLSLTPNDIKTIFNR